MLQKQFSTNLLGAIIPVIYVTETSLANQILSKLQEQDCLFGLDTETYAYPEYKLYKDAALSPLLSSVRLLSIYNGKGAVVFDLQRLPLAMFKQFLTTKKFVAHNALFDYQFFAVAGIDKMNIGCTYILAKLVFHASRATDMGLSASLSGLVEGFLKTDILKKLQTSDWSQPDLTYEQIEYAALDAVCTLKLAEKLATGIPRYGLARYYQLCKKLQFPIAGMQLAGLGLDADRHREMVAQWREDLYAARMKLERITGLDKITAHTIASYLEQHLEKDTLTLWPRTDDGKLMTDAHTFADFQDISPIIEPFAEFQKKEKLTTSFGMSLLSRLNLKSGRLHPQYKICGARTGRLSCTSPNIQQCPRDSEFRKSIIPSCDKVFICADYSQIELRVAAELSRDAEMLKSYRAGTDLHSRTAAYISGKPIDKVTKRDRQLAKAINFGLIYGLGASKLSHYAKVSYGAEMDSSQATHAVEAFRALYPGYRKWQLVQAENAEHSLKSITPCGKMRQLHPENTYGTSMNTPIQGGAAECMAHAMIRLHEALPHYAKIVGCVHDEIIVETDKASTKIVEYTKRLVENTMVKGFLDVFPDGITKNLVEAKVGNNWAEAKA